MLSGIWVTEIMSAACSSKLPPPESYFLSAWGIEVHPGWAGVGGGVVHLGIQLDDWKRRLADPPVIFSCVKMKHKGPHTTALQAKAEVMR